MSSTTRYDAFAITAPGLEPLTAGELEQLGANDAAPTAGGVSFTATAELLYSANLQLRTASRVVVRVGQFGAKAFHELERRAGKVPWEAFVSPNLEVALRVTCRKSRLYHSDAVAERVASALSTRVRGVRIVDDAGDRGEGGSDGRETSPVEIAPSGSPAQLVVVRLLHDQCTVSIDSSGELLHRRGYRQAVAKAPLRETLAAAALLSSGWAGDAPLIDPMCGSGTIPIEGALLARRIAPGLGRHFAFERWPDFASATLADVTARAREAILPSAPAAIRGSDRDAGAIDAARANADRAGVADDVQLTVQAVSSIDPADQPGWVVTNPPYGVRLGERDGLRNLYAAFGKVVAARFGGWRVAMISATPELERQTGLSLRPVLRTSNGGIPVRVVVGGAARSAPGQVAARRRGRSPKAITSKELDGVE